MTDTTKLTVALNGIEEAIADAGLDAEASVFVDHLKLVLAAARKGMEATQLAIQQADAELKATMPPVASPSGGEELAKQLDELAERAPATLNPVEYSWLIKAARKGQLRWTGGVTIVKHHDKPPLDEVVEKYAMDYEFRFDEGGGHAPDENEKAMLIDFGHGLLSEIEQGGWLKPRPSPSGVEGGYDAGVKCLRCGARPPEPHDRTCPRSINPLTDEEEEQLYNLNSPSPAVPMQGLVKEAKERLGRWSFGELEAFVGKAISALEQAELEIADQQQRIYMLETITPTERPLVEKLAKANATIEQLQRELENLREYVALKDGWANSQFYCFQTHLGKAQATIEQLQREVERLKDGMAKSTEHYINRVSEQDATIASLREAGQALIDDVRRRYPGEALRCPYMIALDAALSAHRKVG